MELPRSDFWSQVALLLANIDAELSEIGSREGWSVKAKNMSRRQANVRRAVADLTQHRLTALVRHASTNNLEASPHGDAVSDSNQMLPPLDWQRHDPAERAFYEGLNSLIEKYKHHVSWNTLQNGLIAEDGRQLQVKPGTTQLDSFIPDKGGLTGKGAPKLEVEREENPPYRDPDEDEEDRIARMSGYPTSGMVNPDAEQVSSPSTITMNSASPSALKPHLASDTTAPTTDDTTTPAASDTTVPTTPNTDDTTTPAASDTDDPTPSPKVVGKKSASRQADRIRIRMIQDLPAPIVDETGRELDLMTGDIDFLDSDFAAGLIAAGLAENATI